MIYTKSRFIHTQPFVEKINSSKIPYMITVNMLILHWLIESFLPNQGPPTTIINCISHNEFCISISNNLHCISKNLYNSIFTNLYVYLKQFVFVVENDRSRQCWAPISFYVPRHNNLIVQLPPIKRNQNPNSKEKIKSWNVLLTVFIPFV